MFDSCLVFFCWRLGVVCLVNIVYHPAFIPRVTSNFASPSNPWVMDKPTLWKITWRDIQKYAKELSGPLSETGFPDASYCLTYRPDIMCLESPKLDADIFCFSLRICCFLMLPVACIFLSQLLCHTVFLWLRFFLNSILTCFISEDTKQLFRSHLFRPW